MLAGKTVVVRFAFLGIVLAFMGNVGHANLAAYWDVLLTSAVLVVEDVHLETKGRAADARGRHAATTANGDPA